MAYTFYMGDMELPITPSKLEIKIKNNNKTVNLINEGDINILKLPGLTEIGFSMMIPQVKYPFAGITQNAPYYLEKLEKFKLSKEPFQFIVTRTNPSGKMLFDTNMKVSLEDYTLTEEAENGLDLMVSVRLKQYKAYSTKTVQIITNDTQTSNTASAVITNERPAETAPKVIKYTVKRGDSLWNIAKKYLGDGARYTEIYELNKHKIGKYIYAGQVLTLPSS